MTRIRIKGLSFQDQQTSLYHLHGVIEITSDECVMWLILGGYQFLAFWQEILPPSVRDHHGSRDP